MHRDYWSKPSCQYNAIMLVRILADNPGPGFTRCIDKKFVDTTKDLLRSGKDASVRQILMETLDSFENLKSGDEGLALIIEMWKKEKEKAYKAYGVSTRKYGAQEGPRDRTLILPRSRCISPQSPKRSHPLSTIPTNCSLTTPGRNTSSVSPVRSSSRTGSRKPGHPPNSSSRSWHARRRPRCSPTT